MQTHDLMLKLCKRDTFVKRINITMICCVPWVLRQRMGTAPFVSSLVVSVFVLQACPMVERQQAVGERARITPTTQTGLQTDRQTADRQTDRRTADRQTEGGFDKRGTPLI